MRTRPRFAPFLSPFVLALTVPPALSAPSAVDEGAPATASPRLEWIARHMGRVPLSGGVLPGTGLAPAPGGESEALASTARRARQRRRLSSDLLAGSGHPHPGTQAEPHLHVDPADPDHLVAAWQENRFPDGGAEAIGVAASFDGGATWTEGLLPGLTLASEGRWERASDPWVAFGPDGEVWCSILLFNASDPSNAVGVSRSVDGGLAWAPPTEVGFAPLDFNDKESITVDTNPESPFYGRAYAAWDINLTGPSGQGFVAQKLVVARSRADGRGFKRPKRVRRSDVNVGVVPRVGPDGTVYLVWAGLTGLQGQGAPIDLYFSRSRNGGRRWSPPRRIENLGARGVPDIRGGSGLPSLDLDPTSGRLYVAWEDARFHGVDQAVLMISDDGGETWGPVRRVSASPPDAPNFTVSVAVNARRDVAVSYMSLENDPARRFLVDHFVRISTDGGDTFGPPIRANRRTFDIRHAAQAGGYFLGDYMGLAGSDTAFHALWVDTTHRARGLLQPDVFTARAR